MTLKKFNDQKAVDAIRLAQIYAVSPFIFQGISAMYKLGIMKVMDDQCGDTGLDIDEITAKSGADKFAVRLLLDMAAAADIVIESEEHRFILSKTGRYLASDPMTRVNFDFSADTCYAGMAHLAEALKTSKPAGLRELDTEHETVYQALSTLKEPAKSSWFSYDHFYSDCSFKSALDEIFRRLTPHTVYDIGGNTGKFATAVVKSKPDCHVTIIDLPQQCAMAEENIAGQNLQNSIDTYPCDLMNPDLQFPCDADLWWMSQLVECFSFADNIRILKKIHSSMKDDAVLVISSVFGDAQPNNIAKMVVESQSLYFAAIANGVSRFHHLRDFSRLTEDAGFKIMDTVKNTGLSTSMLFLKK